ncbi:hypothetical protein [Microbacterium sp.]|uniref:hypothetical protein n=1 Tax=Microbacterium sp. TaxID=51671 RepID=UPI002810E90E|nr:hypothetical protein [Microbacterium sp.]
MAGKTDPEFEFELPDLRALFADLKAVAPKLATDVRRDLRGTGSDIIAQQRRILSGPRPGSIHKTGSTLRLVVPRNGRKPYLAIRNTYETGDPREGGVDDLRSKIRAGLKTSVTSGKTRSSIQIKTTGPRNDGYNMAKVWQARRFRHPIFGALGWMDQQGQPYFWEPAYDGVEDMQRKVQTILDNAVTTLSKG